MNKPINYLQPEVPGVLPWYKLETIIATNKSLKGYGCLVSKGDYETFPIEIVQLAPKASFFDKQGSVHGRVSVNFAKEFDVFLEVPLAK